MTDPKQMPFESFGPGPVNLDKDRLASVAHDEEHATPNPDLPDHAGLRAAYPQGEPLTSLPFHLSRSPVSSFVPTYL